jgi:Protein of unknown function (DUF2510)
VSYQQPPEQRPSAPAGAPAGWYPDPGGLRALRWWDGAQWSAHTQPPPGAMHDAQAPYPDATASASDGYDRFRQERVGRHRQYSGSQEGMAYQSGMASDPYIDSFSPVQPEQPNQYQPGEQQGPYQPQLSTGTLEPQSQAPYAKQRLINRTTGRVLAGVGVLIVVLAAIVIAVKVTSGPGTFTAHGTLEVAVRTLDGNTPSQTYPDISDGGQVTVIDSDHNVIGTGALSETGTGGLDSDDYTFTTKVPGGEQRYGIQIGNNRGTVWYSQQQMRRGPELCLGDGC